MNGNKRSNITIGDKVAIVTKKNQDSQIRTVGIVKKILTNSSIHPHGIKVMLEDSSVGRVKDIL